AGRIDHGAVGDGEGSKQRTTAAAGAADRQRVERVQHRTGAGHRHARSRGYIANSYRRRGVHGAAVGDREHAGPTAGPVADKESGTTAVPNGAGSGHQHRRGAEWRDVSVDLGAALVLNTPPLAIVSAPGPNQPITVRFPVTVEPAPVTIMLPATRMSVVCSE